MIDDQVEIPETKTHSIVSSDDEDPCLLRANHIGEPVTYKGVSGWLIRYMPSCKHNLLELSTSEALECLNLNRPKESGI